MGDSGSGMKDEGFGLSFAKVSTPTSRTRTWQAGEIFTASDATELYEVDRWGKGYFSISTEGHVLVHPTKDPSRAIDLKQLTDHLQLRGIGLPVLIRFRDILRHRLATFTTPSRRPSTSTRTKGAT